LSSSSILFNLRTSRSCSRSKTQTVTPPHERHIRQRRRCLSRSPHFPRSPRS
jgi:hypothetical protein